MAHRFALAGSSIAHSLSPAMHEAALESAGLEGSYVLEQCDSDGFLGVLDRLRTGTYTGLNVTMPHKGLAHSLCDRLTDDAEAAGSVNTLRVDDSAMVGHSSDVVAFREILRDIGDAGPLVVMGSGGSARAALAAIPGKVVVVARDPAKVDELRGGFGDRIEAWSDDVHECVLINATPLGMRGEELPAGILERALALIDLPYGPEETPAVASGRERGIKVVDGIEFLARQAAVSFTWWTGVHIGVGTMVAAARNA